MYRPAYSVIQSGLKSSEVTIGATGLQSYNTQMFRTSEKSGKTIVSFNSNMIIDSSKKVDFSGKITEQDVKSIVYPLDNYVAGQEL